MKQVCKWIFTVVLALGTAAVAQAQTWSGWYLGGSAAYGWASSNVSTTTAFSPAGYFATSSVPVVNAAGTGTIHPNNLFGAFNAGYNWQSGQLAYGIEGDIGNMRANKTRTNGAIYPCCTTTSFTVAQTVSTDYVATARLRLGYAPQPNWLAYVTGGAAFTTQKYNYTFSDTFAAASEMGSQSKASIGWVLGGGAEYALPNHWTVRGEYQHMDFGGSSGTGDALTAQTPRVGFPANSFSNQSNLKVDVLRIGFNYRF